MTYLEFQIEEAGADSLCFIGTAYFIIDGDDPRACVRIAVADIRRHGWKPVLLREAEYTTSYKELKARRKLRELLNKAQNSGYAFLLESPVGNKIHVAPTPPFELAEEILDRAVQTPA